MVLKRLFANNLVLLTFFLCLSEFAFSKDWNKSFVRVTTYIQEPDIDAPWRTKSVREEVHMGTVMDAGHILVSAYVVAHSKNFEFQLIGDSKRHPLQLAMVDYNINLALLRPVDPKSLQGLKPVSIGDDLSLGEEAHVYTARDGQRLIQAPLRLREVVVQSALFSPYQLPSYAFDTQKKSAGWSEPIIKKQSLVGMTVSKRDETVFGMPASVIKRFYAEAIRDHYRALPRLGLVIEPLNSPELREYSGLKPDQHGVWIGLVQKNSPFYGALQAHDVLVQVDQTVLNDQGLFQHPKWGAMSFIGALYQYYEGDRLELKVVRNGKLLSFTKVLEKYDPNEDLMPWNTPRDEPYLIFGGLLFQELSQSFLKKWGSRWRERAPSHLLMLWNYSNFRQEDEQKRLIILNRVLADSMNKGYDKLKNLQLLSVNGRKVHSLQDLSQTLSQLATDSAEKFAVFRFAPYNQQVILSFDDIKPAHQRIVSNYEVRDQIGIWQEQEKTAIVSPN